MRDNNNIIYNYVINTNKIFSGANEVTRVKTLFFIYNMKFR